MTLLLFETRLVFATQLKIRWEIFTYFQRKTLTSTYPHFRQYIMFPIYSCISASLLSISYLSPFLYRHAVHAADCAFTRWTSVCHMPVLSERLNMLTFSPSCSTVRAINLQLWKHCSTRWGIIIEHLPLNGIT